MNSAEDFGRTDPFGDTLESCVEESENPDSFGTIFRNNGRLCTGIDERQHLLAIDLCWNKEHDNRPECFGIVFEARLKVRCNVFVLDSLFYDSLCFCAEGIGHENLFISGMGFALSLSLLMQLASQTRDSFHILVDDRSMHLRVMLQSLHDRRVVLSSIDELHRLLFENVHPSFYGRSGGCTQATADVQPGSHQDHVPVFQSTFPNCHCQRLLAQIVPIQKQHLFRGGNAELYLNQQTQIFHRRISFNLKSGNRTIALKSYRDSHGFPE
mmetsp:Transcript_3908/g.7495  ORF Transcript_3908/g.7495 Transcript_3908/m.7495 type:complete len:269 (-) Transcript_3908:119-925(-)